MESEVTAMGAFLTTIGEFFTKAIAWLGEVMSTVMGEPALVILVLAMPICGFAVGLLSRLIRL